MSVRGVKNADGMPDFVYDAVRYSNYPYAQTHPDRLGTVAVLYGLTRQTLSQRACWRSAAGPAAT